MTQPCLLLAPERATEAARPRPCLDDRQQVGILVEHFPQFRRLSKAGPNHIGPRLAAPVHLFAKPHQERRAMPRPLDLPVPDDRVMGELALIGGIRQETLANTHPKT